MGDKDKEPEKKREKRPAKETAAERELSLAKQIIERWVVE
jgi:hypothetical protein